MAEAFVGEIRIVGFNFPPKGWAACNGQLIPISQNTALFSLLGTQFGGNGTTNFALPNLQGSSALGQGQGVGLTDYTVGEIGGSSGIVLSSTQIPTHTHPLNGLNAAATTSIPTGAVPAEAAANPRFTSLYSTTAATGTAAPAAVSAAGNGTAHNNMQPYLTMNFVIALQGIFPLRN